MIIVTVGCKLLWMWSRPWTRSRSVSVSSNIIIKTRDADISRHALCATTRSRCAGWRTHELLRLRAVSVAATARRWRPTSVGRSMTWPGVTHLLVSACWVLTSGEWVSRVWFYNRHNTRTLCRKNVSLILVGSTALFIHQFWWFF